MKAVRLRRLRQLLQSSLWFVPGLATVLAFVGAKLLVLLDRHIAQERDAWFLFAGEADSARELLSTVSSSMMTFMALAFSITIVVLQLTSSQFSPRALRTFLQDTATKIAMAAFVGTFVFAMALLPEVRNKTDASAAFVPALSVFVAFALVLASVGVFIHYIDHMAHAVRAVTIIKRVASETRRCIDDMYPDVAHDSADDSAPECPASQLELISNGGLAGVLGAVDEEQLLELACRAGAVIGLVPLPGDFVARGAPLFRVWPGSQSVDPRALHDAVMITEERTPEQDPAFGLRQLVDIAERALSPGINDPSTAVQALDEIHDLLRTLGGRRFPSSVRVDESGAVRLILPRPDWKAYVHLGLDEIRQYGSGSIQVVRRMRALLEDCLAASPPHRRACLEEQLRLLDESTRQDIPAQDQPLARTPSAQGHGQE